jgi:hypothetical protein
MEDRAMRSPTSRRRPHPSATVLLMLVAAVAVVVACGSSASAPFVGGGAAPAASAEPAAAAGGTGQQGPADNGNGAASGSGGGSGSGAGHPGDQVAILEDTKIVRTGTLQLTVTDVTSALTNARDAIRNVGGYIGASQQQLDGDSVVASVTYRIPVSRWEDALTAIRSLGTEVGEKTDSVEVTGQIVDLDARIRNLKASETALVAYAEQAPKVTDLLDIQSRLTDTRSQIEQLTAQQAQLSDQAAMATLTVTFGTEVVAVTEAAAKWDPAAQVDQASATLISMGQAVVSFLIVFGIVWLPLILTVLLIGGIALAVARRLGLNRSAGLPPVTPPTTPPSSAEA